METISLKMDGSILKDIDETVKKHRYSTRTEFIRDAIREKLQEMEREERLKKYFGASKKKTTDEELERIRERAVKQLAREKGWKLK